jgi:hypothetical protein
MACVRRHCELTQWRLRPHGRPSGPPVERPRRSRRLALTRAAGFNDGFGAQLQRVLGVYCVCREFGYDYCHTPVRRAPIDLESSAPSPDTAAHDRSCRSSQTSSIKGCSRSSRDRTRRSLSCARQPSILESLPAPRHLAIPLTPHAHSATRAGRVQPAALRQPRLGRRAVGRV